MLLTNTSFYITIKVWYKIKPVGLGQALFWSPSLVTKSLAAPPPPNLSLGLSHSQTSEVKWIQLFTVKPLELSSKHLFDNVSLLCPSIMT